VGPGGSGLGAGSQKLKAAAAAAPLIYKMRQRMFAIGDDFWIETDRGERVFKIDGKALRLRDKLIIDDAQGFELYEIQEKWLRVRDSMAVDKSGGATMAKVHNALITPLRDRWKIDVKGASNVEARGNVLQHEYHIKRDGADIAEVSKKWFRIRDSYGVEVNRGEDAALMLMITVCIDMMAHSGR
jgi:uncharacterized protein YxjI